MHAYWHGRKVRLEGSTTHPAQMRLIFDLFGAHCKPMVYAVKNPPYFTEWSRYAWRIVLDLDRSFEFLISLPKRVDHGILDNNESFYVALGGFSDAEGHIGLRGRDNGQSEAAFGVSNTNVQICRDFLMGLRRRGFSANVRGKPLNGSPSLWELAVSSKDVVSLVDRLLLKH